MGRGRVDRQSYLGGDTLRPFVQIARSRQAGIFVLVKTSNPGSGDYQDCVVNGTASPSAPPNASNSPETIYQRVARELDRLSRQSEAQLDPFGLSEIGAVVGATYPEQLTDLRQRLPQCWLLIPGFGAQGGTAADTAGGFHSHGMGAIVNSSRAILYAFDPDDRSHGWVDAVRRATLAANEQLRAHTPTGNL
jgi:orotidine-5'-phosphate decarboxylase